MKTEALAPFVWLGILIFGLVYAVTPFYMLTFVDHAVRLVYARRRFDQIGLWISGCTFASLFLVICGRHLRRLLSRRRETVIGPLNAVFR